MRRTIGLCAYFRRKNVLFSLTMYERQDRPFDNLDATAPDRKRKRPVFGEQSRPAAQ
jgi:hypothetical protein